MAELTTRTSIEQGRANFAYKKALDCKNLGNKYKSQVQKVPMMIKTNGLGATFAFIYSKKDKEGGVFQVIGQQVTEWINEGMKYKRYGIENELQDFQKLVEKVIEIESSQYRALTIEILALFNWLRRFAEGVIEESQRQRADTADTEAIPDEFAEEVSEGSEEND